MANDDFYVATSSWTAVEANGADITNGTFSVFSFANKQVGFIKDTTLPTVENGVAFMDSPKDSLKYTLGASEFLFTKTNVGTVKIGVIPA